MGKLTAIIVEDEYHSREALKNMVAEYCPQLELLDSASDVDGGISLLGKYRPDLVFLDIEMPNGSGFDFLSKAGSLDFEVIFTTAYKQYALKAIKFSAIDYLLKPIDINELQAAVEKAQQKRQKALHNKNLEVLIANLQNRHTGPHSITLSTSAGYEFIDVSDIIYCEASGTYTHFHIKNKKRLTVSKHLKEYENLLNDYDFMRVHQSFLINLGEVERYVRSGGGYIVMKTGEKINISTRRKEEFLLRMSQSR